MKYSRRGRLYRTVWRIAAWLISSPQKTNDPSHVSSAAQEQTMDRRYCFRGVGLLETIAHADTRRTSFLLLYARRESLVVDTATRVEKIISLQGPGVLRLEVEALLPVRRISHMAGEATDGEFRHHVLSDGMQTRELLVRDLRLKWVT